MTHAPPGIAGVGLCCSLLVTSCESASNQREPGEPARATPVGEAVSPPAEPPSFNQRVLALVETYPVGGGYSWPAPAGTHGTTRDLYLGDARIARASPAGTHCSGLTFELFWRALEELPGGTAAAGLDKEAARALLRTWFVPEPRGLGPAAALPGFGLGVRVDDLEDAQPGDFIQVWMNNGRGHTAVFLGWVRDHRGRIVASRHWSTHPATDGIGIEERAIGDGPRDIDREAVYIGRVTPGVN